MQGDVDLFFFLPFGLHLSSIVPSFFCFLLNWSILASNEDEEEPSVFIRLSCLQVAFFNKSILFLSIFSFFLFAPPTHPVLFLFFLLPLLYLKRDCAVCCVAQLLIHLASFSLMYQRRLGNELSVLCVNWMPARQSLWQWPFFFLL